ncbi:MAG: DUF4838 domain-containing protein, partial [Phycisphaeraceae bacterium]
RRRFTALVETEVRRLTAERTLEWMDLQPERRFFWVADQDGGFCECDVCRARDRREGFATDRALEWVNEAARSVAEKHPDNLLFTLAYIHTVAPPIEVEPEPNVILFYCPWWRDGRNCATHDWLCPNNSGAMKQFMDWAIQYPDQLGVYDYGVAAGTDAVKADLIKFLAKNRVRGFYFDGRPSSFLPMHAHITRSLLWNPYLDTLELRKEFLEDCYGPGAPFLQRYFERVDELVADMDTHTVTRLGPLDDSEFLAEVLDLFGRASRAAEGELSAGELEREPDRQEKLLGRLHGAERMMLHEALKREGQDTLRSSRDLDTYRIRVARLLRLHLDRNVMQWSGKIGGWPPRAMRSAVDRLKNMMADFAGEEVAARFDDLEFIEEDGRTFSPDAYRQITELTDRPAKILPGFDVAANGDAPPSEQQAATPDISLPPVSMADAGQLSLWQASERASTPEIDRWNDPHGPERSGTRVAVSLSSLPKDDDTQQPRGSILVRRSLAEPLDVSATRFVEIALHATAYAPVSVYLETDDGHMRANTLIFAGEQVLRVQIPSKATTLHAIEFDFHSQASLPRPNVWDPFLSVPVSDVTVTFFSATARSRLQRPSELSDHDVLWMTRSRSFNINRMAGRKGAPESFRGYQANSELYPLYAIAVSRDATDKERQAAQVLSDYLRKAYGVSLPIATVSEDDASALDNRFLVGKALALRAGMVRDDELDHVGPEGFVLHGRAGRGGQP